MNIRNNYNSILDLSAAAAQRSGRGMESVKIIAVSKTVPHEVVQEAVDAGMFLFGESKIQEAKNKIPRLTGDFSFHLIGHLQSNKAKDAVALFDVIQSIDSYNIAKKVDSEAGKIGKVQKILIQANVSGEKTKSGTDIDEALNLAEACLALNNVALLGFMTIGPLSEDTMLIRKCFADTRNILEKTNARLGTSMTELSMGMSGDFEAAIEEGATMIRIGSLIFGNRNYT